MARSTPLTISFRIRRGWLLTLAKPAARALFWFRNDPEALARFLNGVVRFAPIQYQDKRGQWRNTQQPRFIVTEHGVQMKRPPHNA